MYIHRTRHYYPRQRERERVTNEVTEKGMKEYGPTVSHTISVVTLSSLDNEALECIQMGIARTMESRGSELSSVEKQQ